MARRRHPRGIRKAQEAHGKTLIINQYQLPITQMAFVGMVALGSDKLGFALSESQLEVQPLRP